MDAQNVVRDPHREAACFDGVLLAALAYGALLMLHFQLGQALMTRPKRGRVFWGLVTYSSLLFPLATIAIGGEFKFAELTYVANGNFTGGPAAYYIENSSATSNVMSLTSKTILPWVGDVLMGYRLMVVWNYKWWLLLFPVLLYLGRLTISIPLLMFEIRDHNITLDTLHWASPDGAYGTVYYSLCFALNLLVTTAICLRLWMLKAKCEKALGKLQATFYTSPCTMFVESGAFFTIWSFCLLISRAKNSWMQEVFLQPYSYVLAIARSMVILRIAQNRAWTKEVSVAIKTGVLEWQVSSMHSIPLHEVSETTLSSQQKTLPKKFRDDSSLSNH